MISLLSKLRRRPAVEAASETAPATAPLVARRTEKTVPPSAVIGQHKAGSGDDLTERVLTAPGGKIPLTDDQRGYCVVLADGTLLVQTSRLGDVEFMNTINRAARAAGVSLKAAQPVDFSEIRKHYDTDDTDTATRERQVCGEQVAKWDAVWKAALAAEKLVAPERRAYYTYAVKTGIAMNRNGNHMLFLLSRAVLAAKAGDKAAAKKDAQAALADIAQIKALEKQSEYGKWKNWYRGEWLVGIDETRTMIGDFIAWLDDPLKTPYPVIGSGWLGYYHIMHYEGMKETDVK